MNTIDKITGPAPSNGKRWRNSETTYGRLSIILHWTIALLFVAQLVLGYAMSREGVDPALQFQLFQYHKSIGFVVLALAIPRLAWSILNKKPRLPGPSNGFARIAAHIAHTALLSLTIAVPLAGWAVASTSPLQIPSYVFDIVVVPGLPLEISDRSEALWTGVHETLAFLAAAIVVLHAAAALWHHFILQDLTLKRMTSFRQPTRM